jgi:hemerythrin-like domain-containing protein
MAQDQKQATQWQADAGLDLRNLLALDHKRLDELFEALIAAFQGDAREASQHLWTKLEAELEAHFELEDKLIFPEFAKAAPAEAAALVREHAELRGKLSRLGLGVDLHLTRDQAVTDFVHRLRSHAKREDALLYLWAQGNLTEDNQTTLRNRLLEAVGEFLGIAHGT